LHDVVESFAAGVTSDGAPVSVAELDLRSLAEWRGASLPSRDHPLAVGALGAGFELLEARASERLTAFDGGIGAVPSLAPDAAHAISPTALQDWALCPFSYLLARVLRVRDVPKPEATDTITALDEGTLVHTILEEFLVRARERAAPDEPWDDADRALLVDITREAFADAERRGITGRPLHWRLAQRRVLAEITQFVVADESARRDLGVLPSAGGLEVAFGEADTPVVLDLADGRSVSFRGRIDRVDRSPDGSRVAVYDYKTGAPRAVDQTDPVQSGRKLQLPVYALAARARWGAAEARAFYWYTRALPDDALTEFPVDAEHHDRFVGVVGNIVHGIEHGCFVAFPGTRDWRPFVGDTFKNCVYCPYDRVCPPDRLGAWMRKADDDAVTDFLALDLPEDDADEAT
jgi:RecB family exonuclease